MYSISNEQLNRQIVLRLWLDISNASFGLDATEDVGRKLWAKVEPIFGLTIKAGMQIGEAPTHLFWIRYSHNTRPQDITVSHVVEWQGQRYRVLDAINVDDMQRFTRISAKQLGPI